MKRTLIAAACIAAFSMAGGAQAGLVVTPTANGETLVNTIIGTGVTVTPGSVNYIGVATQAGTFTGGLSAGIGIDEGIILTSGDALLAPGPNDFDDASGSLGTAGDADLDGLLAGLTTTNDANVLTFMFTTDVTTNLSFKFVFASEEYNEYVDPVLNEITGELEYYFDPMGFFLDGTNIGLVPGTSDLVSVPTVHCGNPYTPPSGGKNCDQFVNNSREQGVPTPFDIEYDGFTNVFTATKLGLAPGTHVIKLAVADAQDAVFDSAVFIETGSFSATPVPAPATFLLVAAGLGLAGAARRHRREH
jgi:hypothetical protein